MSFVSWENVLIFFDIMKTEHIITIIRKKSILYKQMQINNISGHRIRLQAWDSRVSRHEPKKMHQYFIYKYKFMQVCELVLQLKCACGFMTAQRVC